jgi:hypothetical protein
MGSYPDRGCIPTRLVALAFVAFASLSCGRNKEPTPEEQPRPTPARRAAPSFTPVKGAEQPMQQATIFAERLPAVGGRLEIRTLSILQQNNAVLLIENEAILELRSGELTTVINGTRQERRPGEMWQAAAGSRVGFEVRGEQAVVRLIYVIKEPR